VPPLAPSATTDIAPVLLGLAVILLSAKLGGVLFERWKQPPVLGELLIGIVIGNLQHFGLIDLTFLREQPVLDVLAELGILLLLFEVGLEWTVSDMLKVGWSALLVAVVGIIVPSLLGIGTAKMFFGAESSYTHLFIGTILCATSVGITARVLQDLGKTSTREAKLILGAAVIDDVLGLMVLATVSTLIMAADGGTQVSAGVIFLIIVKAVVFLLGTLLLGRGLVPRAFRVASRLPGRGVLLVLSLSLCFLLAFLAHLAGLAPIVGAFTAGLILEDTDVERLAMREERTLEELLHPVTALFLPVFFLLMGLKVDLRAFGDPSVLLFAAVLTLAAVIGKLACGAVVRGHGIDRWVVAFGMVPRGEVGLIFAGIGLTLAVGGHPVVSGAAYSGVVIMVMVTTLVTPLLLKARFAVDRHAMRTSS
jgi:Kef-type K+ transport system membrane component KefB